jgi:hypothetical protein
MNCKYSKQNFVVGLGSSMSFHGYRIGTCRLKIVGIYFGDLISNLMMHVDIKKINYILKSFLNSFEYFSSEVIHCSGSLTRSFDQQMSMIC